MSPSRSGSTPKAKRTRQRILDAAFQLFRDRGFDSTSMRDIADAAGLSQGSAYYYFPSKESLVYDYYLATQEAAAERNRRTVGATTSFSARLRDLIEFKLTQLDAPYVAVLARSALDPTNPLSPFSPDTKAVRDESLEVIETMLEGSDVKVHRELRGALPRLLWLYQMAMIFLYLHDRSAEKARTRRAVDASLGLLDFLLPLTATRLPGMRRTVRLLSGLLEDVAFWEEEVAGADSR